MFSEEEYQQKIKLLEEEVQQLKEKLKNYTAPKRSKTFYENHKEEINQKTRIYKDSLSTEKKKEYARTAYLNKKEKLKKVQQEKEEPQTL
jgi:hypothetical protein